MAKYKELYLKEKHKNGLLKNVINFITHIKSCTAIQFAGDVRNR